MRLNVEIDIDVRGDNNHYHQKKSCMSSRPNRSALIFSLSENSYLVAFIYAAVTAAITTSLVVEYRLLNPFGTYIDSIEISEKTTTVKRITHILQTATVAFITTLFVLVILHLFFSFGDSMLGQRLVLD